MVVSESASESVQTKTYWKAQRKIMTMKSTEWYCEVELSLEQMHTNAII